MPYSVFAHDANPAVDRRVCHISSQDGRDLLAAGRVKKIGKRKLQYVAPARVVKENGSFNPAPYGDPVGWEQRISGYMPVLQMTEFLHRHGVSALKSMPSNGWPQRMVFD